MKQNYVQGKKNRKKTGGAPMNKRTHNVLITAAAILVVFAGFVFISNFLTRIRASNTKVFVSSTGSSLLLEAEQPSAGTEANKISAFDLTIATNGTEQISTVGNPATYPGGDTTIFTPIIPASGLPAASVHIAYVIQKPTADLPVAIEVPIATDGTGNLSLEANAIQEVVGYIVNATDNVYQIVSSAPPTGILTPAATNIPPMPIERPRAVVNFPAPNTYTAGQTQTDLLTIVVDQPVGGISANKISAFDLTVSATGAAEIIDVGNPATYPGGDTSIFTPVIIPSSYPTTLAHIAYVIQRPTADLPTAILIPVTTQGKSDGLGSIMLDTSATAEVVGVISGSTNNSYQVVMQITNSAPTPMDTTIPSPGPSQEPTGVPMPGEGSVTPAQVNPSGQRPRPTCAQGENGENCSRGNRQQRYQRFIDFIRRFLEKRKGNNNSFWRMIIEIIMRFFVPQQ